MKTIIVILSIFLIVSGLIAYRLFGNESYPDRNLMCKSQLAALGSQIELFHDDKGYYPKSLIELTNTTDPLGPYSTVEALKDPWGNVFYYRVSTTGKAFKLFNLGSDSVLGGKAQASDLSYSTPNDSDQ
jgi:type II secretory pathway pseudopilin PulG